MHLELDLDTESAAYLQSRLDRGETAADVIGLALQLLEEWENKKFDDSQDSPEVPEDAFRAYFRDMLARKAP